MFVLDFTDLFGAKHVEKGIWIGKCSVHQDRRRSLKITYVRAGALRLRCTAGCPVQAILKALGISWKEYVSRVPWTDPSTASPEERAEITAKVRQRRALHSRACRTLESARSAERIARRKLGMPPSAALTQFSDRSLWRASRRVLRLEHREKLLRADRYWRLARIQIDGL